MQPGGVQKKPKAMRTELSRAQKEEIKAAFDLFDSAGAGVIGP